jgi:hypothetical protein
MHLNHSMVLKFTQFIKKTEQKQTKIVLQTPNVFLGLR